MATAAVQSKAETTTTQLSWTDKEIKSFKVNQKTKAVDWETVKVKYEKTEIFHENYPKTTDMKDDYPHVNDIDTINKTRVTSRTKNIRASYRKAFDLGKIRTNCYDVL